MEDKGMKDVLDIGKRNRWMVFIYILMLSVVLAAYFILVAMQEEGYDFQTYPRAYMGFMLLSFMLFSIFLPFWELRGQGLKRYAGMVMGVLLLTLAAVPHILTIFMVGRLYIVGAVAILAIQAVWGGAVLCFGELLDSIAPLRQYRGLLLAVFILMVLAVSTIFLYFYIEYNRAVVTTVFDRRIPTYFFLNPLISAAGLLNVQTGGAVQGGYMPYPSCLAFWTVFCLSSIFILRVLKIREGKRHGKG